MPKIANLEEARASRRMKPIKSPDGAPPGHVFRTDILTEDAAGGADSPNAKLIEQPAGSVLQSHFHCVDQFQVVVEGSGWIGKHEVSPLTLHFAGAYTGYGPIRAGASGLSYLVFRLGVDAGAAYLPESRAAMKNVPRQYVLSGHLAPARMDGSDAQAGAGESTAIEEQANGLSASVIRLGPGEAMEASASAERGCFVHVVAGQAVLAGQRHDAGTCIALAPAEAGALSAAGAGAQLLLLQFPRRAAV